MPTTAAHVWRPSAARTITLDAFVPVPRGTTATPPAPLSWPLKDPADLLDYQFDIAPALIGNDGDAIATLDIAISPAHPATSPSPRPPPMAPAPSCGSRPANPARLHRHPHHRHAGRPHHRPLRPASRRHARDPARRAAPLQTDPAAR